MTFEEWWDNQKTKDAFILQVIEDDNEYEKAIAKLAFDVGYDAGQSDGYEEGTRNGWGLDDGRAS